MNKRHGATFNYSISQHIGSACAVLVRLQMLEALMRRRFGLASLVLVAAALFSSGASAEDTVATPALDASIFRDGEVESRDFHDGEWHAKCQQIIKIRRRICNLLSTVVDSRGIVIGSVLIATTDAGIPAMMISIPSEISVKKAISVEAKRLDKIDGQVVKVEFSQIVNPMICDTSCKYMFPLDPKLVYILNAREQIELTTPPKDSSPKNHKKKRSIDPAIKQMIVPGQGFAEILTKTTAPW